jgi:hypothetical protein
MEEDRCSFGSLQGWICTLKLSRAQWRRLSCGHSHFVGDGDLPGSDGRSPWLAVRIASGVDTSPLAFGSIAMSDSRLSPSQLQSDET